MKTSFIWPNTSKAGIEQAVLETCRILAAAQVDIILPDVCSAFETQGIPVRFLSKDAGVKACDCIITLGGDGTMLHIAALAAHYAKPLIGVNFGRVGFMTELERSEIHKIAQLFEGAYSIDSRMMLDLQVVREKKVIYERTVLNDVVVSKKNPFRVIGLSIMADGVPVSSFSGDGVIIATPTGSTAYSLSAGGPIVEPSAENIAVTPVCAHALQAKSFVFAPERKICVTAQGPDRTNVCVSADGYEGIEVAPGDYIMIKKSQKATRLLRVKGRSFYHILGHKLTDGGQNNEISKTGTHSRLDREAGN